MLEILEITTPIYLLIGLGYALTRWGTFERLEMRSLGKFVVQLALPALLLHALAQRRFGEIFNFSYLLAYTAGALLSLCLAYQYARRVRRLGGLESAIHAMGACSSNSGFVGYPILLLTIPKVAAVALALNMLVENLLVIPVLLLLADHAAGGHSAWRAFLKSLGRLLRNPLFVAIVVGVGISLTGWQLPAPVEHTVTLISQASGALSLFVIGGTLVGLHLSGLAVRVAPVVGFKLFLHPALVALCVLALPWLGLPPLEGPLRTAAIVMAAVPMMSIYPALAQAYHYEDFGAAALLLATVASFFTLSGLLWVFHL